MEISADLKAALEKLTAGSLLKQPVLRPGELVCLRINEKQVAETQGCNCAPPCSDPASKIYTFEGLGPDDDHVQLGKTEQPAIDVPDGVFRERLKEMGIAGCVFWGGDYPHYDCTFPGAVTELEENLAPIDKALAESVRWRTAERFLGLK